MNYVVIYEGLHGQYEVAPLEAEAENDEKAWEEFNKKFKHFLEASLYKFMKPPAE